MYFISDVLREKISKPYYICVGVAPCLARPAIEAVNDEDANEGLLAANGWQTEKD
jgi:hypothetical protein